MIQFFKKYRGKPYPFLFILISTLLIFNWFKAGYIYGGGDVGLQTYDPARRLEVEKFVWWESVGPGSPLPQGLSTIPFQFSLYLLQSLGFSPVALQAALFFLLLTLMGFGMYLFLKHKMTEGLQIYPLIGGLFYMLNPYIMISVWHRFIHTTIMLAAVLPFFALFWDKWIREGKTRYLIFFLVASLLSVYVFGTYAYIITVWIFLLLITVTTVVPFNKKLLFKAGGRFLFGFVIWILLNCWWILPIAKISPALLSSQHQTSESIETLVYISAQAILPYSLQLINPYYLFFQADFGGIYKSFFFQIIPWIFTALILTGLIRSFKTVTFSLFGIFYLFSVFLAKGAAPPFGQIFIAGFKNIFALGVFRNPFEKTGLILVFFTTVLFILGIKTILEKLKNPIYGKAFLLLPTVLILVFSWPMFAGKIFGTVEKPAFVKVPQSYQQADGWLREQKENGLLDGKILHLPLTRLESVRYNWEFGYNGLEPSDTFFTAYPSISRGFNVQRVDDVLTALSLIFRKSSEDEGRVLRLLQAFNVRFIVLHKDLNWLGADVDNPDEVEQALNGLNFIKKKVQFEDLIIYQVEDDYFKPRIEFSDNLSLVYPQESNMKVGPWLVSRVENFFVSPVQARKIDESIASLVRETLIFPENVSVDPEASASSIYNFWVDAAKDYELLANPQISDIYINKVDNINSLVNGQSTTLQLKTAGNMVSLGVVNLKQGLNQISFVSPVPVNLIPAFTNLEKVGNINLLDEVVQMIPVLNSPAVIESPLGKTFGNDIYQVSFEGQIPAGVFFYIQVIQDSDAEDKSGKNPRISLQIPANPSIGWQAYKFNLPALSTVTREAKVRLLAATTSNQVINGGNILIKNLQIVKTLSHDIFLRNSNLNDTKTDSAGEVLSFTKINPTRYEGVVNLQKPGFLFFKETYHPGWKLQLKKADQVFIADNHYLGLLYGNAWYIGQEGEYQFKITFEPQKNLYYGIFLSGLGIIGLSIFGFVFRRVRRDEK